MTIIFREKKGAPLTSDEVDGNFRELLNRIEKLESLNSVQERLATIKQENDELILISNLGIEWGRVQLPTLRMTPRGPWQKDTSYIINDLMRWRKAVYICLQSHKSSRFDNDKKCWLKLFEPEQENVMTTPEKSPIPLLTKTKMIPSVFGSLAVFMDDNILELLLGDMTCWRRVRDMQEFKIPTVEKKI